MEGRFRSLENKAVVVVGTGGIGGAIVGGFLEQGCFVYALDKERTVLDGLRPPKGADLKLIRVRADVTEKNKYKMAIQRIGRRHESIRSFVYCAGIGTPTEIGKIEDGLPEKLYELNVCGFIYGLEYILPFMEKKSSATVISSINAWRPEPKMSVYDSTKAALIQYIRTASVDLGPQGIRVNAIAPGYVRTPQTEKELEDPANVKKILDATSLGRIGEPEDISGVAVALSSDDFGFVTGSVIEASGGLAAAQYAPMKKQINIRPDIENGRR